MELHTCTYLSCPQMNFAKYHRVFSMQFQTVDARNRTRLGGEFLLKKNHFRSLTIPPDGSQSMSEFAQQRSVKKKKEERWWYLYSFYCTMSCSLLSTACTENKLRRCVFKILNIQIKAKYPSTCSS